MINNNLGTRLWILVQFEIFLATYLDQVFRGHSGFTQSWSGFFQMEQFVVTLYKHSLWLKHSSRKKKKEKYFKS